MTLREAPVTWAVAILTLVVSAAILLTGSLEPAAGAAGFIPARWSATPIGPGGSFALPVLLTPLSATLVHGGLAHVALNLLMLLFCGQQVERALGGVGTVILYVAGAYAAAVGQWALGPDSTVPTIGASGAISAILAAYALLYGARGARSVGPIPAGVVHVMWLAVAWLGIQALVGLAGMDGWQIAIGAHIGGFVAGLALARPILLWRYRKA
ncbi:Membrane associated serine protease, rhomboid family [Sphingomonas gellani]|uniref:Membrane associated serine protease, rhomboid family n=1 Tax=Sphingomonas gellani TaxID=1166340 RepID=A0A1H8EKW4_9SPHN|nr:rhomboid family intramembrane serine protease [Sphingomonas gellani]SEN20112.1 Membrane associated serine protease, rhomboid family [Sphingomonas gellani]